MDNTTLKDRNAVVTFGEALRVWLKIGWLSFGGPAAQIALMHRLIVDEKRWIDEQRFLHALNYCMLLPGPEAQQLATYIGWLLHRTAGGLAAGLAFILPGFFVMLLLSIAYAIWQEAGWFASAFFGIKAAVLAIVVQAVIRIGKRALNRRSRYLLAALAFVGIFFLHVPFPLIVLAAGFYGFLASQNESAVKSSGAATRHRPWRHALTTLLIGLSLWWLPPLLLWFVFGTQHVFIQESLFFSKMAVVTFGGAYAVLSYVAQAAVQTYHWLTPLEMIDGLGLAETTPGPLIMVTEFVGFLAAWRNAHEFSPLVAGIAGATLTTWVTFVPCFLWIFLGAPYVEALRENRRLAGALSCITAAVVGVILNLTVWFTLHVIFSDVQARSFGPLHVPLPAPGSIDVAATLLAVLAAVAILRFKLSVLPVIAACALLGVLYGLLA